MSRRVVDATAALSSAALSLTTFIEMTMNIVTLITLSLMIVPTIISFFCGPVDAPVVDVGPINATGHRRRLDQNRRPSVKIYDQQPRPTEPFERPFHYLGQATETDRRPRRIALRSAWSRRTIWNLSVVVVAFSVVLGCTCAKFALLSLLTLSMPITPALFDRGLCWMRPRIASHKTIYWRKRSVRSIFVGVDNSQHYGCAAIDSRCWRRTSLSPQQTCQTQMIEPTKRSHGLDRAVKNRLRASFVGPVCGRRWKKVSLVDMIAFLMTLCVMALFYWHMKSSLWKGCKPGGSGTCVGVNTKCLWNLDKLDAWIRETVMVPSLVRTSRRLHGLKGRIVLVSRVLRTFRRKLVDLLAEDWDLLTVGVLVYATALASCLVIHYSVGNSKRRDSNVDVIHYSEYSEYLTIKLVEHSIHPDAHDNSLHRAGLVRLRSSDWSTEKAGIICPVQNAPSSILPDVLKARPRQVAFADVTDQVQPYYCNKHDNWNPYYKGDVVHAHAMDKVVDMVTSCWMEVWTKYVVPEILSNGLTLKDVKRRQRPDTSPAVSAVNPQYATLSWDEQADMSRPVMEQRIEAEYIRAKRLSEDGVPVGDDNMPAGPDDDDDDDDDYGDSNCGHGNDLEDAVGVTEDLDGAGDCTVPPAGNISRRREIKPAARASMTRARKISRLRRSARLRGSVDGELGSIFVCGDSDLSGSLFVNGRRRSARLQAKR